MMEKIILLLVLSLISTNVYGEHVVDVNEDKVTTNEEYPDFKSSSDKWLLSNKQFGGAVLTECRIKFKGSANCTSALLKFTDGVKTDVICNNMTKYMMYSKYSSIRIELRLEKGENNAVSFRCNNTAMAYGKPDKEDGQAPRYNGNQKNLLKQVNGEIRVNDKEVNQVVTGYLTSNMRLKYRFRSPTNQHVDLRCQMVPHVASKPKNKCDGFFFQVEAGTNRVRTQCETSYHIPMISEYDVLDVTINTGAGVSGYVKCNAKAVKQFIYSWYKNVPTENVDSSEFGSTRKPGKKRTTCSCGWANKVPGRILFGKYTAPHEFPWSVSLQLKAKRFHFCGGSIITSFHILTSAHCIGNKKAHQMMVVMSTNDRTNAQVYREVLGIYQHQFYNKESSDHDLAILDLKTEMYFNLFVGPVCLTNKDPMLINKYVTAMGWGQVHKSEEGIKDTRLMKKTNLRVIDMPSCSFDWRFRFEVDVPKMLCTWTGKSDVCFGDSGGPLTYNDPETNRFTLVGLPALCDGCVLSLPTAHTAVYYYYNWIQFMIKRSAHPYAQTCSKID